MSHLSSLRCHSFFKWKPELLIVMRRLAEAHQSVISLPSHETSVSPLSISFPLVVWGRVTSQVFPEVSDPLRVALRRKVRQKSSLSKAILHSISPLERLYYAHAVGILGLERNARQKSLFSRTSRPMGKCGKGLWKTKTNKQTKEPTKQNLKNQSPGNRSVWVAGRDHLSAGWNDRTEEGFLGGVRGCLWL